MIAIVSLLVVVTLSLVTTRIATVALTLTGLSRDLARFQARSAFSGCGFTTAESEQVINHPVRRRIIMLLILLGNAGIITSISSLILAFVRVEEERTFWIRLAMLGCGVGLLWLVASSSWVSRWMEKVIRWALRKWTSVEARDYASLLRLSDDFAVSEMQVEEKDWVVGRTLAELDLRAEGATVLGIQRSDGGYVGVPRGSTMVTAGDVVVLYGQASVIDELDRRRRGSAGDQAHRAAVREEAARLEEQEAAEHDRAAAAGQGR